MWRNDGNSFRHKTMYAPSPWGNMMFCPFFYQEHPHANVFPNAITRHVIIFVLNYRIGKISADAGRERRGH